MYNKSQKIKIGTPNRYTSKKIMHPLCTMVHNAGRWCTTQVNGAQRRSPLCTKLTAFIIV